MMIPAKLKRGDEIRIIAPSDSASIISKERIEFAKSRLEDLGFLITFGRHVFAENPSYKDKASDINDAFRDKNVKGILSMIGGNSSYNILPYICWEIPKDNPKVFCGYSDIDVLSLAIYTMTGLVTYSGVHFSTFSQKKYFEYTEDYFVKCLLENENYEVISSKQWSDDEWFIDQDKRNLIDNDGFWVINEGEAFGTCIGTNISSVSLLRGTQYYPNLSSVLLFLEKDESWGKNTVIKLKEKLSLLVDSMNGSSLHGLVFGRFTKNSGVNMDKLKYLISSFPSLCKIPVIGNVDFGHTDPKITLPIGGQVRMSATKAGCSLSIVKH